MPAAALRQREIDILNGDKGFSSPLAGIAFRVLLGTRLQEVVGHDARIATAEAQIAALGAPNTDAQIPVELFSGLADAGTWAKAVTSGGVRTVTRTAAAATHGFWIEIPVRTRTSANKGFKLRAVKTVYSVNTANATDIRTEVYKRVVPADNAAPGAPTLLGGDQNAHYDAAHDTSAERGDATGAPENHTSLMTLPTPAYIADGEILLIKVVIVDPGTSALILKDVLLIGDETVVDLT